jgi:hypothetical protein
MLNFFRKTSKIHLDCFTFLPGLTKLFPVVYAEDRIPLWHKNVPPTVKSPSGPMRGTMKMCPGVTDLFKKGIILQAWKDMYIDWSNSGNSGLYWEPNEVGETHTPLQWNNAKVFDEFIHFKCLSPWKFVEKTEIKWLMMDTFWHDPTVKYNVPTGMVEYTYQYTTNVNMWIRKNSFPKNLTIHAGKELSHIIPLSEKDVVIHQHEISQEEYIRKYMGYQFSFSASYYKKKKILNSK